MTTQMHPTHNFMRDTYGELRCTGCDCRYGGIAALTLCGAY